MNKLLILFLLASCVSLNSNVTSNNNKLDFHDDLNFDDFKKLLIEYAKISPYPNIDK